MDYIYQEDYLSSDDCQRLINYFDQNVESVTNVNPRFSNRVIYYEGVKDPKIKELMGRIHSDVAKRLKAFYQESGPILPEATHIVKWPVGTALGNHADNAYEDGTPNYVSWRTYSAVLYLNQDYQGGEFYFQRLDGNRIEIQPRTGLLVGFTAGLKHLHGVNLVREGVRYALPMWFCADQEKAYV